MIYLHYYVNRILSSRPFSLVSLSVIFQLVYSMLGREMLYGIKIFTSGTSWNSSKQIIIRYRRLQMRNMWHTISFLRRTRPSQRPSTQIKTRYQRNTKRINRVSRISKCSAADDGSHSKYPDCAKEYHHFIIIMLMAQTNTDSLVNVI